MRRGLISWSREEVPAAVLDARVGQLQKAMLASQLDAVLAYTSFAQPAPVQWLTHFVPYWSEALLMVLPKSSPALLASLTERVHPWIREVSHIGEIISAPRLGEKAAMLLNERTAAPRKIGVIGFDALPWSVAEPLIQGVGGDALVDASSLYATLRQPADWEEAKLAQHATSIGEAALEAIPRDAKRASEILAAVESVARLAGAEEVLQRIAPDLGQSATLLRIEGDAMLGERFSIELSIAYKGAWVRLTRCVAAAAQPRSWGGAANWVFAVAAEVDAVNGAPELKATAVDMPGKLVGWTLEASIDVYPLSVIATHDRPSSHSLPPGSLVVLSVHLALDDGPWRASVPLILGASGDRNTLLIE
ncbi:aminopeptidase P family N-terminal domain-containing protein [Paraburkholderia caffeinilytica]|uniref:aminopeptidase P family N-terminal domain-containing protein n=1 Tax=Paraburkholderia caffeinilytica TaxID=1761016 RepID=UPI003D9FF9E0